MADLRVRLRSTREHHAALADATAAAAVGTSGGGARAIRSGNGFGVGFGGRFGYGAAPPWEIAATTYDPVSFAEYFAWRPGKVFYRFANIALRLGDIGTRVYVKRGTVEERATILREHFTALGPAFVKFGQVLSTRSDLLPAAVCFELAKLQDNLPAASHEHAVALLARELRAPPEALFEYIPEQPIAAASLAQVYRARVRGGLEVAVKLQRPGLAETLALDSTIMRSIALALRRMVRLRSDFVGIVDELVGRTFDEMDYRLEAASIRRFHNTYAGGEGDAGGLAGLVRAPLVLDELSTSAVLVMEWIDGTRLTDLDAMLAMGIKPSVLLERGVRCSLHQLLETGFMHSDPHPGNLVVGRDGALVYLDFGMVVEVPRQTRRAMIRGLVGFVNRDAPSMVRDLQTLDFLPPHIDVQAATAALRDVFDRAEEGGGGGEGGGNAYGANIIMTGSAVRGTNDFLGVVSQLSAALIQFGFRLPPYFARILRALAALEGTATGIDSDFKVIERAYPYVLAQVLTDRSPEMRQILRRLVLEDGGEAVRWSRVRRLINAYIASGSDGGKGSSAGNGAGAGGFFGGGGGGHGSFSPFDFSNQAAAAAAAAVETFNGLAEGAREVVLEAVLHPNARAGSARSGSEFTNAGRSGSGAGPRGSGFDTTRSTGGVGGDAMDGGGVGAVAEAVRDAMSYILSPDGAPLRANLVRDVLGAGDAYLHALTGEEREEQERRRVRRQKDAERGGRAAGGDTKEEGQLASGEGGHDRGQGEGGQGHKQSRRDSFRSSSSASSSSSDSSTGSSTSSSTSSSASSAAFSHFADLGVEDLAALAETGRKMYLKAPRTWAPVLAAAAARPEACEMAAAVVLGAAERATCDNVKLVTRGVIRSLL